MLVAVDSLTRKVSGGVAIDTARMAQYWNHLLESGGRTNVHRFARFCLRSGICC